MRINELLICVRDAAASPQKYAIKFYLLIYGRIQICIDYANGIGLASGSGHWTGLDSGFWFLVSGHGNGGLNRGLNQLRFHFFPAALRCVLSLSLCLIHDPFFAAKQIVNV